MKLEQSFLNEINKIYDLDAQRLIIKAFNFADQKHSGQMRDSGEEYITHPYQVSKILIGIRSNRNQITEITVSARNIVYNTTDFFSVS